MSAPDRLMKIKEVVQIIPVNRATIYRWVKQQIFPAPVRIGSGTFWRHSEIQKFIAAQPKTTETGD